MTLPTRMLATVLALVLALVLAAALLAGCSGEGGGGRPGAARPSAVESSAAPSRTPAASFPTYVALGDSYTAAPLISQDPTRDGCLRASLNYPRLVAEELGSTLSDVSCSGARTEQLRQAQDTLTGSVPPQLEAVTAETSLVTIGLGGNDAGIFERMLGCTRQRAADPTGSPCRESLGEAGVSALERAIDALGPRLVGAVRAVRRRAPEAEVVVVGYPRFIPAGARCPDRMPLADGDVPFLADLNARIAAVQRRAARDAGTPYVDVYAASAGHDVCSRDPWVNGQQTVPGLGLAFHPLAAEQRAVADLVLAALAD